MIAGITHLALEAPLEDGARFARQAGFSLSFSDEVRLPATFEGVAASDVPLPLALHAAPEGVQLEVVRHGEPPGGSGAYSGVFGCAAPLGAEFFVGQAATADAIAHCGAARELRYASLGAGGAAAWFDAAGGAGGLRAVICRVPQVEAEAAFWERFARTRWGLVTAQAACGIVPSPVHRTRTVLILEQGDAPPAGHQMNDAGFPSIGVASTAIEADYEVVLSAGAAGRAAPTPVTVGGRRLRLALIASPGGAPIELLAADRVPRASRAVVMEAV